MRIHNLWEDANGISHWRDIEVEWVSDGPAGKLSKRISATGIIFRKVPPTYELDWHPAPRRQMNLAGPGVVVPPQRREGRDVKCLVHPISLLRLTNELSGRANSRTGVRFAQNRSTPTRLPGPLERLVPRPHSGARADARCL